MQDVGFQLFYPLPFPGTVPERNNDETFQVFAELFDELKDLVAERMDRLTRTVFSWTCRTFYRKHFNPSEFDPFRFMDKCAKLGYQKLLAEGVQYEMPVDIVTICKAARQGHSYAELWKSFLRKECEEESYTRAGLYYDAAKWAARGGHLNLSRSLLACSSCDLEIDRLVLWLAEGGHLEQAERVYANLSDQQRTSFPREEFARHAFVGVTKSGNPSLIRVCFANYWNLIVFDQECVQALMVAGIKLGSLDLCITAQENGWEPNDHDEDFLFKASLASKKFQPNSDHLACLQFLFEVYGQGQRRALDEHISLPTWVDLDGLDWLYQNGFLTDLQRRFELYCGESDDHLRAVFCSHIYIDELVDWFLANGAKVTLNAFLDALSEHRLDLMNDLWQINPQALPKDAFKALIDRTVWRIDHSPSWQVDEAFFHYSKRKKVPRVCPLKKVHSLLQSLKCLLKNGFEANVDGLPQSCDQLAIALHAIDPRAARIFCQDAMINEHLSEETKKLTLVLQM